MRTTFFDGVDHLWIYPDMDEGKLYYCRAPYPDRYGLYFIHWLNQQSDEYREWLPER